VRLEPNLLLALSTTLALALLVLTASVFGKPEYATRYAVMAVVCGGVFLLTGPMMAKAMKMPAQAPLIQPGVPAIAVLLPLVVMTFAAAPLVVPGKDVALLIIIASVFAGLAIRSALAARQG
jgi:hypothetical protein